jgi:hypothetical protein
MRPSAAGHVHQETLTVLAPVLYVICPVIGAL